MEVLFVVAAIALGVVAMLWDTTPTEPIVSVEKNQVFHEFDASMSDVIAAIGKRHRKPKLSKAERKRRDIVGYYCPELALSDEEIEAKIDEEHREMKSLSLAEICSAIESMGLDIDPWLDKWNYDQDRTREFFYEFMKTPLE